MATDNDRYGYDELRWLAKDTQQRRRRATWTTAGLTLAAMALATAYVASDRSQPSVDPDSITVSLDTDELVAKLDSINVTLADIKSAIDAHESVTLTFSAGTPASSQSAVTEANYFLNNIVWLVEGSRRFPMAQGDILWVPEANRWIKLEDSAGEGRVSIWDRSSAPPDVASPLPPGDVYDLPLDLPAQLNTADCVTITSLGPSTRLTGGSYVDIDVYFFNAEQGECVTADPVPL